MPKPATIQLTDTLPSEQDLHITLDLTGGFNLITDERFLDTLEAHLSSHRERPVQVALAGGAARIS